MTIHFELWQFLTMVGASFVFFFGAGSYFVGRMETRLEKRFEAIEKQSDNIGRVEREFLALLARLPAEYVRHDEHVRVQAALMIRLDRLSDKIDYLGERRHEP